MQPKTEPLHPSFPDGNVEMSAAHPNGLCLSRAGGAGARESGAPALRKDSKVGSGVESFMVGKALGLGKWEGGLPCHRLEGNSLSGPESEAATKTGEVVRY